MDGLSVIQFASLVGSSRGAVYGAIASGKLPKSAKKIKGAWRIMDEKLALTEWAAHHNMDDGRINPRLRSKLRRALKDSDANADGGDDDDAPPSTGKGGIPRKSHSDAVLAAIKARTAQIELDEKMGALVKREEINRALFAAGQEIREAFMVLTDRVIDDIMAATTRDEAHGILSEAIAVTLERISDTQGLVDRNLKMKQ